jgi:ferric iron reductase protein FhuF
LLEPVPGERVAAALTRAGGINELLTFAPPGADTPWPAAQFAAAAAGLVDGIGRWLGIHERRVAASLVVLGYAARLAGPTVAVLLRDGVLVDARPGAVRFGFAPGRGFRLALVSPAGLGGRHELLVERWRRDTVDGHLAAVITAVRAEVPVSAALLWGNVASGVLGALATLVRARASAPERCLAFARDALAGGPLAGTGSARLDGARLTFRRRSCCLYYRLPGGGYCGDCCFTGKGA